jgi:hypothetical protein
MSILPRLRRLGLLGYIKLAGIIITLFLIFYGLSTTSLAIGVPILAILLLPLARDSLDVVDKAAELFRRTPGRQPVDTNFLLAK